MSRYDGSCNAGKHPFGRIRITIKLEDADLKVFN